MNVNNIGINLWFTLHPIVLWKAEVDLIAGGISILYPHCPKVCLKMKH